MRALIGDDHRKHIGGHDRADEGADVDDRAAAGEDMGEAPGSRHDEHENRRGEAASGLPMSGERQSAS